MGTFTPDKVQGLPDEQKLEMIAALMAKIEVNQKTIWALAEENDVMRQKIHELLKIRIVT